MFEKQSRLALWIILGLAGFFANTDSLYACSCMAGPTLVGEFDRSNSVVIARMVGFENADDDADSIEFPDGLRSVKLITETIFKGKLKVGALLEFRQGQGTDCSPVFGREEVDKRFLFYLSRNEWSPTTCGRSSRVEYAAADLLYLNDLRRRRGHTRISGTLKPNPKFEGTLAGWKVQITGKNRSVDLLTDKDGVYEVYDLRPGDYQVYLEGRDGWRMEGGGPQRGIPVSLPKGDHEEWDIRLVPDNAIRGTIQDSSGNPMKNVQVELQPASDASPSFRGPAGSAPNGLLLELMLANARLFRPRAYSNARGEFSIESIPDGVYVLAVNPGGQPSGFQPFPTFYYPNVTEKGMAETFEIGLDSNFSDLRIRTPESVPTVTVKGRVLYSDGKPAAGKAVRFEINVQNRSEVETDAMGNFSMPLLKGQSGTLSGAMHAYFGQYEKCPALDTLMKAKGWSGTIVTRQIQISATEDKADIDLRLPVPDCKIAKSRK